MLTNREKTLIGLQFINHHQGLTYDEKYFAMQEYVKIWNVDFLDLTEQTNREYVQFHTILSEIKGGKTANFNYPQSFLSNREKYIFYNVAFLFQKTISRHEVETLKAILKVLLVKNENTDEIIKEISDQINETDNFISYVSNL